MRGRVDRQVQSARVRVRDDERRVCVWSGPASAGSRPRRGRIRRGSAVAVATGMSLASIGADTGGSIRIPAAACGVVGLKPSAGEVSCEGVVPLSRSLDHVGPLCRTVTDAAIVQGVSLPGSPLQTLRPATAVLRLGIRHFPGPRAVGRWRRLRCRVRAPGRRGGDVRFNRGGRSRGRCRGVTSQSCCPRPLSGTPRTLIAVRIVIRPAHPTEAGRYVLAEDYVRGQTLRAQLTRGGRRVRCL